MLLRLLFSRTITLLIWLPHTCPLNEYFCPCWFTIGLTAWNTVSHRLQALAFGTWCGRGKQPVAALDAGRVASVISIHCAYQSLNFISGL